jgi:hypothetical protein
LLPPNRNKSVDVKADFIQKKMHLAEEFLPKMSEIAEEDLEESEITSVAG